MVPGTQVGAYRVLEQIGEGGMGAVWLAEHTVLGRRAAIKVLHATYSHQTEIVSRFFNEAKAATAISDPGIVQIFDFGTHVDGSAYIVMELLDGQSLSDRLRRVRALSLPDMLRVMQQVATSLGAAHARGIVHRDLKPENIFLVRDAAVPGGERAKILDFGIAKLVGSPGVKTHTHAVMGTPTFMSPEQCRGAGGVDQRSDVYSMGCVMYMLLTGHPVFDAEGVGDIIAMHLREPPPIPSARLPALPREIDELILRCLAKAPAQRFHDGNELAHVLAELCTRFPAGGADSRDRASSRAIARTPAVGVPVSVSPQSPTTMTAASGFVSAAPTESRRTLFVVLGVSLVALGGGIAWIVNATARRATPQAAIASNEAGTGSPPPTTPAPSTTSPGASSDAAVVEDPATKVPPLFKSAFASFSTWAAQHAGASCPDAATLGLPPDPWGTSLVVTCTDQPADQAIGLISSGPDGKPGTEDDIASWTLGRDVVATIRGGRWKTVATTKPERSSTSRPATSTASKPTTATASKPVAQPTPKPMPTASSPTPDGGGSATKPKPKFVDKDGDGIPDSR